MPAKSTPDVYCEFRMNKLEGADERSTLCIPCKQLLDCISVNTHTPEDMNQLERKKVFY